MELPHLPKGTRNLTSEPVEEAVLVLDKQIKCNQINRLSTVWFESKIRTLGQRKAPILLHTTDILGDLLVLGPPVGRQGATNSIQCTTGQAAEAKCVWQPTLAVAMTSG